MRVNVETRALADSRFFHLMASLNWNRSRTIGALVLLWHDSQDRLKTTATKEEIMRWIDGSSDQERSLIFEALVSCLYLSKVDDDLYYIHGNKKHVAANEARTVSAIKAGIASGKTRKNKNLERDVQTNRTRRSNSSTVSEPNSTQYNTNQCITNQNTTGVTTLQNKTVKTKETTLRIPSGTRPPGKQELDSSELWIVYQDEYFAKHKAEPPPRNAKVNSQLCVLVKHFGKDRAKDLIRHYFKLPDAYYFKSFHPIGLLVTKAHEIYSSMTTGRFVNNTDLKQMESALNHRTTLEKIRNGEI